MDVFVEQVVARKRRGLYDILFYGCWALLVACGLVGLVWPDEHIVYKRGWRPRFPSAGHRHGRGSFSARAFLLWRASMRLRTEYDYSFTNGVLDVARVMNGRKRVYLTSFDVRDLRAAGEESSSAFQSCARQTGAQLHRWYLNKEAKKYFFFYDRRAAGTLPSSNSTTRWQRPFSTAAIFRRRYGTERIRAYESISGQQRHHAAPRRSSSAR